MLVIRLARTGRAKYPTYRIVAAESSRAVTGKFIEVLGHYNPHTKEISLKKEATLERLSHGAQPSNTVVKLLQREKVELPAWAKLKTKNRKPKSEPEEKPEVAPAQESAADEAEAPVALTAEENAAAAEANAEPMGQTETAEAGEEKAEAAAEASSAAADSAEAAAKESQE